MPDQPAEFTDHSRANPDAQVTAALSLRELWLCEALRLREAQAGPLDDSEAARRARADGGSFQQRIVRRAELLGRRDGQWQALQHWLQGAQLALLVLLLLAAVTGIALAFAAVGDNQRPVNVFWALGGLLGLNLVTLVAWLMSLVLSGDHTAALGRLWLWLSEKLARDARAAQLAPALLLLLQRRRLGRWGLGLLSHGTWTLVMATALLTLLAMFATRRYDFVWETTILSSDTFIALTQMLGSLPAWLGFDQPGAGLIRASGDGPLASEVARQGWAAWLVGVLLIYGLLPRLVLMAWCGWRWRRGLARLELDLQLPGYRLLRERLLPGSERLGVSDAAPDGVYQPRVDHGELASQGRLLAAVELDGRRPWPPPLPEGIADGGVIDSREQRQQLLDQLSRAPVQRLLIACDPRRSPDRGTLALLAELAGYAGATRIWLLPAPPGEQLDANRLADWHAALENLDLPVADSQPLAWLETDHA